MEYVFINSSNTKKIVRELKQIKTRCRAGGGSWQGLGRGKNIEWVLELQKYLSLKS